MNRIQEYKQKAIQLKEGITNLKKSLVQRNNISSKNIEKIKQDLIDLAQNVQTIKEEAITKKNTITIDSSYESNAEILSRNIENQRNQHREEFSRFVTRTKKTLKLLGMDYLEKKLLSGCNYSTFIGKYSLNINPPAIPNITIIPIPSIKEAINCDESYINELFAKVEEFKTYKNWLGFIKLKAKNDNDETFKSILEQFFDSAIGYCDELLSALSLYEQFNNNFDSVNASINDYKKQWKSCCEELTSYLDELNKLDVKKYINEIKKPNSLLFDFLEKFRLLYNFYTWLESYEKALNDALAPELFADFKCKIAKYSNNYSEFLKKIKKHIKENPNDFNEICIIFNNDLEIIIKEKQELLSEIEKHIPNLSNYLDMLQLQEYLIDSPSILTGAINNPNSFFVDACPIEKLEYAGKRFYEFLLSELENLNSDILKNMDKISKNLIEKQKIGKFEIEELKECYNKFLVQRGTLLGYIAGFSEHICLAYMNRYCQRSSGYDLEKLNTLIEEDIDDNDINSRERKYIKDLISFIDKNIGLKTGLEFSGEDTSFEVFMKTIEVFRHLYLIQYNLGWIEYSDNAGPRNKYIKPAELFKCIGISYEMNKGTYSDDDKRKVDMAFDKKYMAPHFWSRIGCYPVEDIDEAIAYLDSFNAPIGSLYRKKSYIEETVLDLILYDYFYYGRFEKGQDDPQIGMLRTGIWWEMYKHNRAPGNVNYEKINSLLEKIVDNLYKSQTVCYFFMNQPEFKNYINTNASSLINNELLSRRPIR